MKIRILILSAAAMSALAATGSADVISPLVLAREVPRTIAHQGRIAVNGVNYTGDGVFKFSLYLSPSAADVAQAEALVSNGKITAINIIHGGSGYTEAPTVGFSAPGGNGTRASATASISGGVVTAIHLTASGSGYSTIPVVDLSVPYNAPLATIWSNSYALLQPGGLNQPPSGVTLPVVNGLYATALGDPALMVPLPDDLTPPAGMSLYLRIWFRPANTKSAFEELLPHQPLAPVPFALHSRTASSLLNPLPSTDGLLVTGGALGEGSIPDNGPGARLMWFSGERAFRAGEVSNAQVGGHGLWDEENTGRYSTAMGLDPLASGYASVALGDATQATGGRSLAAGKSSVASGYASFAAGQSTVASGDRSFAVGQNSEAQHAHSAVLGYELKTGRSRQTVVGAWNVVSANDYFVVGGGTGEAARKNLLTVDGDGDLGAVRHVTAAGAGTFQGALTTHSSLSVDGNALVQGFLVTGGPLQVNNSAVITGDVTVRTLTITGGADLAEPFDLADPDLPPGSVVVIDESHAGRLTESSQAYDRRVAGIISGAGGIQPGVSLEQQGVNSGGRKVALTGRVYVQADAGVEGIRPGDLLTTSGVPGHAMKAADPSRSAGAILGKAMSRLDSGCGLVLVLVSLQ